MNFGSFCFSWNLLFHFAVVVWSLSHIQLFATPWTAARQASLSFTISCSSLKLASIELMMPSNHLSLCYLLLILPSVFSSVRVFYNELACHIRWQKDWSFSFSIVILMNIQNWFPLGLTGLVSLLFNELSRVFSSTTIWKFHFFGAQPSLLSFIKLVKFLAKSSQNIHIILLLFLMFIVMTHLSFLIFIIYILFSWLVWWETYQLYWSINSYLSVLLIFFLNFPILNSTDFCSLLFPSAYVRFNILSTF